MRATPILAALLAALPACGEPETEFVLEFTSSYCHKLIECTDPVLEVFDGLPTEEECEGMYGPPVADMSSACKLDKKAAQVCLDEMATLRCPDPDQELDDVLPPACDAAWKKCEEGGK